MNTETRSRDRFRRYAWAVLLYNLPVILWGAVVRATGSGAGCNDHWPLCDGSILPGVADAHKLIEYSHRLSSGFVLVLSSILFWWACRAFPKGHAVRLGAGLSFLFTVSEALVGAALVRFGLVAHDQSVYRAVAISVHLSNTFMLLGSLALTAWWASGGSRITLKGQGLTAGALIAALCGALAVGITGSITALGDTLFPAKSVAEIGAALSPSAHFLQHLRVYHPYVAVSAGIFAVAAAWFAAQSRPSDRTRGLAYGVTVLFVIQICAGFMNLFLRAPIGMQLAHLLLADSLWITLVLLSAAAFAVDSPRATQSARRPRTAGPLESVEGMP